MGSREIGIIIASLVLPALALGVVFLVASKLLKRDLTRLPRRLLAPGVTGFMMVGAVVSLIVLHGGGPATARAADEEKIIDVDETRGASTTWIRVYPLENWGEDNRRHATGEEITRIITASLREHGLHVKKGLEIDPPVGLYDSDGERPTNLINHYRKIAPFISVTGYVSTMKDGRIEVHVTLSDIDKTVRSSTVLELKQKIPRSAATISQMARKMAEEMSTALEESGR